MFFYLSKTLGFFILPSNFLCALLVLGIALRKTRFARSARTMSSFAIIALLVIVFSPLGTLLILPLEERFAQPDDAAPVEAPFGIIVLGGAIDTILSQARGTVSVSEAGERLFEAVKLAHRFPKARILFTGGHGRILYRSMSEADAVERLFLQMGISPDRLIFERKARNTWQNAKYTKALIKDHASERWLLITSAYHMARSVGCFNKVGLDTIPWPVDYRSRGASDVYRLLDVATKGWRRTDTAVREWVGLIVYRLTGRTSEFLPGSA